MNWDEIRWNLWDRFDVRYRLIRLRERILMKFVWSLPSEVIYWATIRALANATSGRWGMESPSSVSAFTVLDRWGTPR